MIIPSVAPVYAYYFYHHPHNLRLCYSRSICKVLMYSPQQTKKKIMFHETKKVFDPTESAGLGLLNEMSLVETKVRLEANERRRAEAEEARRREILLQRAEKEADLRERYEGAGAEREGTKQCWVITC